jgi:hypothetical protein
MRTTPRRRFVPAIEGFRLEERVVLSGVAAAQTTAAATIDPLNQPTSRVISGGKIESDLTQIHSTFQAFINRVERACKNASQNLANGQNPDNLLAGLKTYESLQAGNVQVQLERVARSIPGGDQYLFKPPQGVLPPGTAYPDPASSNCGPDVRYFVPPSLRLMTQVQTMVAFLNSATTLQQACGPDVVPMIMKFYQNCTAATNRYVHCAVKMNVFVVPGWS